MEREALWRESYPRTQHNEPSQGLNADPPIWSPETRIQPPLKKNKNSVRNVFVLLQFSEDGFYIYIEASRKFPGESARLSLTNVSGDQCLTFFYHMLGFHVGQLNVLINDTVVMSVVGKQGWEWEMAQVKLNGSQNNVSFKKRKEKTASCASRASSCTRRTR